MRRSSRKLGRYSVFYRGNWRAPDLSDRLADVMDSVPGHILSRLLSGLRLDFTRDLLLSRRWTGPAGPEPAQLPAPVRRLYGLQMQFLHLTGPENLPPSYRALLTRRTRPVSFWESLRRIWS